MTQSNIHIPQFRIGQGYDIHALVPDRKFILGGVHIPYEKGLHSLFEEGMKKTRNGNSQMGTLEPKRGPKGSTWLRPAGTDTARIKISDLPAPQLPEK